MVVMSAPSDGLNPTLRPGDRAGIRVSPHGGCGILRTLTPRLVRDEVTEPELEERLSRLAASIIRRTPNEADR
jgi:hypothetical protein